MNNRPDRVRTGLAPTPALDPGAEPLAPAQPEFGRDAEHLALAQPVPGRDADHLAIAQPEPARDAEHLARAQPERRRKDRYDPVVLRRPGPGSTLAGANPRPAEPVSGVDLSPLAGYGVVGMLATLGLVFAGRQWLISERERKALSARADALADKLLDQSEQHKAELLDIFRVVGPGLQSMASTLSEYREFLAQQRMERELERARRRGSRGTA